MQDGNEDGRPHEFDRRSMLRKLAVGGSVVWISPMIAKRASALMPPSQCVNGAVLNWTSLYPTGTPTLTNPANIVVPGTGVTVTISSTITGTTAMSRNFQVQNAPHGGINGKSLMFEQFPFPNTDAPGGGGSDGLGGQTITISFSTSVRNLSFTITDIDNQSGDWSDRLTTITAPTSYVRGSGLRGIGAAGNGSAQGFGDNPNSDGNGGNNVNTGAFRNSDSNNNLNDNSAAGNLTLNYSGGVAGISSVSFRYWCGGVGAGNGSNQRINLSNITFDTCPQGVTPNVVQTQSPVEPEVGVPRRGDDRPAPGTRSGD